MAKPSQTVVMMQQPWEYYICWCTMGDVTNDLNSNGASNWELVTMIPGHDYNEHNEGRCMCIYKRPVT